MTKAPKYRVLGENDDASECACCGRQGLLRVVWIQALSEDGEEIGAAVPFGRVCASKAAGWGYGSNDRSGLDRKIRAEIIAEHKRVNGLASAAIGRLEAEGKIVRSQVAYAEESPFGNRSYGGGFRLGYIFTLPNDSILALDHAAQVRDIPAAKARRNAAYPICGWMEGQFSIDQIRALLA